MPLWETGVTGLGSLLITGVFGLGGWATFAGNSRSIDRATADQLAVAGFETS